MVELREKLIGGHREKGVTSYPINPRSVIKAYQPIRHRIKGTNLVIECTRFVWVLKVRRPRKDGEFKDRLVRVMYFDVSNSKTFQPKFKPVFKWVQQDTLCKLFAPGYELLSTSCRYQSKNLMLAKRFYKLVGVW